MCLSDVKAVFLLLSGLSFMTFGVGAPTENQKQPTNDTFEEAIGNRELLSGYFSVYKGKKDLRIGLAPEQLDRKLGFSASLVGALGDYRARNGSFRLSPVAFEKVGRVRCLTEKEYTVQSRCG